MAVTKPGIFSAAQGFMPWIAHGISCIYGRKSLFDEIAKTKLGLDATKRIGRALVSWTFDIEKVLKYAIEMIKKIMNVEAGSLMLRTDDKLKVAYCVRQWPWHPLQPH